MNSLNFVVDNRQLNVQVNDLIIAGWTGRNNAAIEHHIAELEAIGVSRPRTVPCFYRVGVNLLSTAPVFDVTGDQSSGEAEFVLISDKAGLFVGIGSDHTDREVEKYGVTVSKQMCPKPVGKKLWEFQDVQDHWDDLILRSWVTRSGKQYLYQEGTVAAMLPPQELINRHFGKNQKLPVGTAMYCGTLPLLGAISGGEIFEVELEDPVMKRKLKHAYSVRMLAYAD